MPSLLQRLGRKTDRGLIWETLSRVFVTLGIFLLPILVLSWTPDVWETPKAMVLFVTVGLGWICYFIAILLRREHRWKASRLDWVVIALWGSYGISTIGSTSWWVSLTGISGSFVEAYPVVTAMIGLYFLTGQIFHTDAERRLGWSVAIAGLGLALVFQMFQFSDFSLLPPSLPRENTVFSTLSNSLTDVSILAAIFGAAMLLLWNTQAERWQRWSIVAGVLLSWIVVLLAGRPVGWAMWAIGMIAVVLQQAAKGKKAEMRLIFIAVILAAAGMAAQLFGVPRQAGLANGPDLGLDQATTRTIVRETLSDRPFFGTGGSTWYQNFVTRRPVEFNATDAWATRFIKANTGWWQSVAAYGLVGVIAWAGVIALGAWMAWKRWAQKPDHLSLLVGIFVVATGISGFFTTWSLLLLSFTWFFLGLQRSAWLHETVKKPQGIRLGFPVAFLFSALGIIGVLFFAGRIYTAHIIVRQAQAAIVREKPVATIVEQLERALSLNAHESDAAVLLAGAYVTQAEVALQKNDTATAGTLVQKSVTTMRTAIARDPKNPAMIEAMNNLLNRVNPYVADAVDEASRNFLSLQKLEPTNPIHDVGYGQTLMLLRSRLLTDTATDEQKKQAAKYFADAMSAYTTALKKKADYPQALFAQAQGYEANNESTKAVPILETLVTNYPQVPVFWIELGSAYSQAKQNDQAVTAYERAITMVPTDAAPYLALADHYTTTEQLDLVKQTLDRGAATAIDPTVIQQRLEALKTPATE